MRFYSDFPRNLIKFCRCLIFKQLHPNVFMDKIRMMLFLRYFGDPDFPSSTTESEVYFVQYLNYTCKISALTFNIVSWFGHLTKITGCTKTQLSEHGARAVSGPAHKILDNVSRLLHCFFQLMPQDEDLEFPVSHSVMFWGFFLRKKTKNTFISTATVKSF